MTFPIDITIPAAANDPADDQGPMQKNFENINSFLKVDHTNPASTGAGTHLQVSFGSNNPPTFPLTYPELFTNTQDGAGNALPHSYPELFFYTGVAGASKDQYVSTANGSVLLMGGIIMKWGVANLPGTGFNQAVMFPVQFPNNCFSVIAIANAASNSVSVVSCTSFTVSQFIAIKTSSSTSLNINYIAIGN